MKIIIQLNNESAEIITPKIIDNNYTIQEITHIIGNILKKDISKKIDIKILKSNTIKDLLG